MTRPRRADRRTAGALLACAALLLALPSAAAELSAAARAGAVDRVRQLLDGGADPNETDDEGVGPIHHAASRGHAEVIELLIARGADVDLPEFDGDTALINASAFGHSRAVEILLAHGADPDVQSSLGLTPIQHARRGKHREVVALLRAGRRAPATTMPLANRAVPPPPREYGPGYARRLAVVVGIDAYREWPPLAGAAADARRVAATLRGLGFDEVHEVYDEDATRAAILDLMGRRLRLQAGKDDLVMIYFAGHGATETLPNGERRGYLVPVEGDAQAIFSTAIPMQQLRALTSRLAAKHVYFAMDSCYSGLGFTRGISRVQRGESDYFRKVTRLRAVQMITAGAEGEQAIERDGHGLFSTHLIDALRGGADSNADGYVTASEIAAFVGPRVTNDSDARQTPQSGRLAGEGEVAFELPRRE